MRYERKYRISDQQYDQVLHQVMSNPAAFAKSYPDRYVNSIYYDTDDFKFYHENVQGISQRVKYRIRWYGEEMSSIKNPIIEKKIKSNMLGSKEYIKLDDVKLKLDKESFESVRVLKDKDLLPIALVRYKRSYMESQDHSIRATIDQRLNYFPVHSGFSSVNAIQDPALILEIKYDEDLSEEVDYCLQAIPYRLTKNSKYVSAFINIHAL